VSAKEVGPRKWTKKDVKALCFAIDGFWLSVRPTGGTLAQIEEAERRFAELISVPARRVEVVLRDVRGFEQLHAQRYRDNCSVVGNEIARFGKGLDDELVRRFVQMAKDEDASGKKCTELRERILAEGLPKEVLDYDPFARRPRT
jgi:hypothetical protein